MNVSSPPHPHHPTQMFSVEVLEEREKTLHLGFRKQMSNMLNKFQVWGDFPWH